MSILISAHELSHAFGSRPLFKDLSFVIESGQRIGLVGPNGAGKSTLLKILAAQIAPDQGRLSLIRGLRVGYLAQVPSFLPQATLLSTVLEGASDPHDWESGLLAQKLISQLELDGFSQDQLVEKLSGGWKKRVALARELMKNPDLLLLDEPTNHLDVESILWLEDFLDSAPFAVLTITHDRLFLQKIAQQIWELNPRFEEGLLIVRGDYATYLELRESQLASQERREVVLKNTLRRETEWLRRGAKARTTKQEARIQRQGDLQKEVAELGVRNQNSTARLNFQGSEKNPKKLIEAQGISKSYEGRTLFAPLDLLITPGTRLGLLGRNGCGKSTLIRVLLGWEPPSQGTVKASDQLSVAYFDQSRETLDPDITVKETLCPAGDFVEFRGQRIHIHGYLDRFLFNQSQRDMTVGQLSGGEQSRLLMARLMLTQANVLILDEPTNDLDMATLQVLEESLIEFPGAVILVTHDRYFLDHVAHRILAFPPQGSGQLIFFEDLSQWEPWHAQELRKPTTPKSEKKNKDNNSHQSGREHGSIDIDSVSTKQDLVKPSKRKLSFKEQRELDSMESSLAQAEALLEKLTQESLLPENISRPSRLEKITQDMAWAQSEVDRLYQRWAELEG